MTSDLTGQPAHDTIGAAAEEPADPQLSQRFRDAMARFPSGVTIVTTRDEEGYWWGFTATSFCSVSADPPLVLVCLARTAQCYPVFQTARSWLIQVLSTDQEHLAVRFSTRGVDKFSGGEFEAGPSGHPELKDACTVLECTAWARHDAGGHIILIGRVVGAELRTDSPTVYFSRNFHSLHPMSAEPTSAV